MASILGKTKIKVSKLDIETENNMGENRMAMRFRKSTKVAPGVKINLGKKSAGISMGGKYGGVSYNSRTGARARTSIPGTGISFSNSLSGSRKITKSNGNIIEPCSTAFDEKAITSLNDAAFSQYSESYTAYAGTLQPDDDPALLEECANTLKIINAEYDRRKELQEEQKRILNEPSLKLLVCGIICAICGVIVCFFSLFGVFFVAIGLTMLFAELRK